MNIKKVGDLILEKGPQVGDIIPAEVAMDKCDGAIGKYIETQFIKAGFDLNNGPGPDIKDIGIEIKTKDRSSQSSWSISAVAISPSIDTEAAVKKIQCKMKVHIHVEHDRHAITRTVCYNFDNDMFQTELHDGAVTAIEKIKNGEHGDSNWEIVDAGVCGYFERINGTNSWKYRMKDSAMQYAKNSEHIDSMFTF